MTDQTKTASDFAAAKAAGEGFLAALRALPPGRDVSIAVTNTETGLLWLSKAEAASAAP